MVRSVLRSGSILGLLLVVLVSCNRKVSQTEEPLAETDPVEVEVISAGEQPVDTTSQEMEEEITLVLSLARTPCYGECPVYSVKLYSDQTVVYRGTKYCERIGFFRSTIPYQNFQQIQEKAAQIQFFDLSHKFPEEGRFIADIPNTVIGMQDGDSWHEIVINYGAPDDLLAYISFLDDYFSNLSWTSIPDPLNSPD